LQLALGNSQFLSQDDFFIQGNSVSEKITIDLLIIPVDDDGTRCEKFSEGWEHLFTQYSRLNTNIIQYDTGNNEFIPLRTIITFDAVKNNYKTEQFILENWPLFKQGNKGWFDVDNDDKQIDFYFDQIPFFYMDPQRDILNDIKLRNSYLGKMLSNLKYPKDTIETIEKQIKSLNETVVSSNNILSNIKSSLKELDTAMDTNSEGVEITPFTKKIRDLNKSLSIYYADNQDSFSMEYHGMGTRSWSSLLTLKSFISLLSTNVKNNQSVFFPILAIEEPEAHLHPNAQKKLYGQMDAIVGQKIISTHSPYIAATAALGQIRNFYKDDIVTCGSIDIKSLNQEEIRKINRQVINTKGEIFFSKLIVFFEGETEEQALPILAQKYFNQTSFEMGVDFVGVGGCKSYLPFLMFAENLNIPWVIFSDAEDKAKKWVNKHFKECKTNKNQNDVVVFLDANNDFENQLISDGFTDEIKQAIIDQSDFHNEQHKDAKVQEIENYNDNKLYDTITGEKTKYGPAIAEQIIKSDKDLPPKVIELFEKIKTILNGETA
jgi:putative ATP-dependent endonuclease of OLD family